MITRTMNDIDRDVHVIVERIRELSTALATCSARKQATRWYDDRLRELYLLTGQRNRLYTERMAISASMATTS